MSRKLNTNDVRFYEFQGEYFPSVTSILKAKAKGEGYERWLGNAKSYRDACNYRDERADIGLEIHKRVPGFLKHRDPMKYRTHRGYMVSLLKAIELYTMRPVLTEEPVLNLRHGYGGTMDMLCQMLVPDPIIAVLDWKTGAVHEDQHPLQVSRYMMDAHDSAWGKSHPKSRPTVAVVVPLREDGNFKPNDVLFITWKEARSAASAFLGVKKAFDWEHRHDTVDMNDVKSHAFPLVRPRIIVR